MFQDGSAAEAVVLCAPQHGSGAGRHTRRHPNRTRRPCVPRHAQHATMAVASLLTISRTFDSLFKVLFIFPSRYLFAIGLSSLFSLGWGIPPVLELQSQTARLVGHRKCCARPTGLSPSAVCRSRQLGRTSRSASLSLQHSLAQVSKLGLVPLHSPLLGESLLVSFPPLTDMLKFSGCSCLV